MEEICASFEDVLERILLASDKELNQILDAVTRRYCRLFPDWDILFLSLPREPEQRKQQLKTMLEQLAHTDI